MYVSYHHCPSINSNNSILSNTLIYIIIIIKSSIFPAVMSFYCLVRLKIVLLFVSCEKYILL